MGQLSAAPVLSLFEKSNLTAKYVFASINFAENVVLCLQSRAKTIKKQTVLKESQEPQTTRQAPLAPPLLAYTTNTSTGPKYWGLTSG